jgi:hypothetical protein
VWSDIITPIICAIWIVVEFFRLYFGYAGNLQEKARFLILSCMFALMPYHFTENPVGAPAGRVFFHDHIPATDPNRLFNGGSTSVVAVRHNCGRF